jgi:hypothetical protein
MDRSPVPRGVVLLLLVVAVLLPVGVCVILALAALLQAMGDVVGARVIAYVAWALGAAWLIDLIGLVVLLAVQSLLDGPDREE